MQLRQLFALAIWLSLASISGASEWIHWRGPNQNGYSDEKNLPEKWSPLEPGKNNLVWKQPVGCRSTPLVMKGRVYVISKADSGPSEGERVVCFDAHTGKILWEHKFNVFHTDVVSNRLGWTNLGGDSETGNVYAHTTGGLLICYTGDGKVIWTRSLTEEYGRVTGYGGRIVSPTVDENLVIVGMINASWGDQGRGGNRFVAFDKKTGEVVWWSMPSEAMKGTYYSNPVIATIKGERLLITGGSDGALHAIQVRTGKPVWSYPFARNVVNPSPVVAGNLVYCSHGEENPEDGLAKGRVICIDASQIVDGKPKLVWEHKRAGDEEGAIEAEYASPLLAEGKLYICNNQAKLFCLDAATGKLVWRRPYNYGRLSRGSPVFADGKIYVCDVNANFHILKPTARGCDELHKQFFKDTTGTGFVETNGSPAIAYGRVYIGTADDLYCIGKPDAQPSASPPPSAAAEGPAGEPAWLQVSPADVSVYPGATVQFKARLFDALGRFVKETEGEWSLPQPPQPPTAKTRPPALAGTIEAGKLTVAPAPPSQQGYVEVKVGNLVGRARVRVAPKLPYTQDFEKIPIGAAPAGWVNAQGKYDVIELDGNKVLRKIATDARPPLARANGYISLPNASGYTIQADIRAQRKINKLPDAGIVCCRYTLILDGKEAAGESMQVRLVSWEARPRVYESAPFTWKEDTWYTAKLTVQTSDGKTVVKAKVWPRDTKEPDKWQIEYTDPSPNLEGAAAVYGYVSNIRPPDAGSEIYFDNVKITLNAK